MTVRRRSLLGRVAAVLAVVAVGVGLAGALHAQTATPPDTGAFDFDDLDTSSPSLLDVVRPQIADIALFAAFAALALVSFFRKSVPLKYLTLGLSVLYLGLYKSQLISVVNIFGVVTANLPILSYSLAWYAFAVFALVTTVLFGRFYCGRICAFGALTQLIDAVVPAKLRVEVPKTLERRASYIKYAILFGAVAYYLATREIGFYRYIEPFWMFTFSASAALWAGLAVLLIASVFVRNLYCRFLCPVGAALGLLSALTVFRIKRWPVCNTCALCEKTCEWGAIRRRRIVLTECVRCDDCERLYADRRRCPHWLLEAKRKARAALELRS